MDLRNYHYELPEHLIAQTPLEDRAASRLLHLNRVTGEVRHRQFRDCLDLLREGDLLVVNNTRVSARRFLGVRETGGKVEVLVLREARAGVWEALVRPAKRLKSGERLGLEGGVTAEVLADLGEGRKEVLLEGPPDARGRTPLPPYITASLADPERYQTVYAQVPGSAAAPTAGLHFTPEILAELRERGVDRAEVTLDISLDTFRPISVDRIEDHVMHGETCSVSEETAEKIRLCQGRIIAVGTTSVRTLESLAIGPRKIQAGNTRTQLFLRPGSQIQVVDGLFTNFHMPGTTMLLMLAAFSGREKVMAAYAEAVHNEYRFLSFGDSMLIL